MGRVPLSSLDKLLSSSIIDYSVQAGPLLVLHVSLTSITCAAFRVSQHTHAHKRKKKKKCCKQLSIRPTTQQQRQHGAEMYKNLQYLQSLRVHRQSAITGSTRSAAPQRVCSSGVASFRVPYWDFSADCCFIVKLPGTLCCLLYSILFCSGKIVLECRHNGQHSHSGFAFFSESWSFLDDSQESHSHCGCWIVLTCIHLEIVRTLSYFFKLQSQSQPFLPLQSWVMEAEAQDFPLPGHLIQFWSRDQPGTLINPQNWLKHPKSMDPGSPDTLTIPYV